MFDTNLNQCGKAFEEKIITIINCEKNKIMIDKQKKSNLRHCSNFEFSIQYLKNIQKRANCQITFKYEIDDKLRHTMQIIIFINNKTLVKFIGNVFVHSITIVSLN